ncbi:MAG: LLM class flavin-dependent oxidoreductase [Gammaproteobacteria bacterium]|nr:LLM class flavin-dependent oxidoreductase [Gammaproteobacteria bacterium]
MKFGYFCNITNWNHKPYTQVLDEVRDIAVHCDGNHWDSFWLTEHHLNHEGMDACPNPLMLGADIAARTEQIRIGQAANIITFWNPIRVAEDIAMLDQMSGGRVECGVGRGVYGREAIHMNADADLTDQAKNFRLFDESLTIMKKAWTQELFSHDGEFYQYPAADFTWQHDMSPANPELVDMETSQLKQIGLTPRPLQQPHPPLWQVVDGHRSIDWAGRNGLNAIMWIPTVKALKERFEVFRAARSEAEGRDVPLGEGISLVRDMFVADSMDEARELAGEGIITYLSWIAHWRGLGNHMDPGEELPETPGKLDLLTYEFLHPRNMLFGTPKYVSEKIEELQDELNLQHLQVWSNFPGVPHDKVMNSVKLFTEKVMPRFAGQFNTAKAS